MNNLEQLAELYDTIAFYEQYLLFLFEGSGRLLIPNALRARMSTVSEAAVALGVARLQLSLLTKPIKFHTVGGSEVASSPLDIYTPANALHTYSRFHVKKR